MKKLLLIFCLFMLSCDKPAPALTIEKEKMVNILSDLHIAEELVKKFREVDKDSVRKVYLYDISVIHAIDSAEIAENIKVMQNDGELAFLLYQDVYKRLDSIGTKDDKSKK